jgi:H+/Cl- antiporter ClcA
VDIGRGLVLLGLLLVALGLLLIYAPWLLNWFGRLPGDICIERDGFRFYLPLASMLLISLVLSLLLSLLLRWFRGP